MGGYPYSFIAGPLCRDNNRKMKEKNRDRTTSPRAAFPLALVCCVAVLAGCASIKVEKTYTDSGLLREVTVREKNEVREVIELSYDRAGRLVSLTKSIPAEKKPVLNKKFYYDSAGRLRIKTHSEKKTGGDDRLNDTWVESFFYDSAGRLYRAETSFKSSYSIARSGAPLLITRYHYDNSHISRVTVNAGVFRRELTPLYRGDEIKELRFTTLVPKNGRGRFDPEKTISFDLKRLAPVGAKEEKDGKSRPLPRETYMPVYKEENLRMIMLRPVYAKDREALLDYLMETLIPE